jgi:glycosyltransferase involved in cell wall biosynthesis
VLYVSRLEPENNAEMVIEAFKRVRTPHKLLVVGDAPYAHEYIKRLRASARRDRRIVFTGFVFGDAYRALQQNALVYVHATEVGGTHPALLEAMGYGNCVLTLDTPENLEAVGEAAIPYADARDLESKLQRVLKDGAVVNNYRRPRPGARQGALRLGVRGRPLRKPVRAHGRTAGAVREGRRRTRRARGAGT